MRNAIAFALVAALSFFAHASAAEMLDLYRGRAIVTGTGEKNRQIGFAIALEDVLVKVSGDARLIGDPREAALAKDAAPLVASFTYRDRMEGIPMHDEQGSHDRPHDLTVTFDKAKIDAALKSLGLEPWTGPRPRILLFVAVKNGERSFMLTEDGERGADMRESLGAAAFRVNMPVMVPSGDMLAEAGVTVEGLPSADLAKLDELAKKAGGERALAGTLAFSDAALGWLVDWRIEAGGKTYEWQQRGVSFDDAFRSAVRGAMQVLSGRGQPR
jgi:hypothetical protein